VLSHELDMSPKPLFETGETRLSSFRNWTLRFCRDGQQSGASSGFDDGASPPVKRRIDKG
jgi:hypothetical protein